MNIKSALFFVSIALSFHGSAEWFKKFCITLPHHNNIKKLKAVFVLTVMEAQESYKGGVIVFLTNTLKTKNGLMSSTLKCVQHLSVSQRVTNHLWGVKIKRFVSPLLSLSAVIIVSFSDTCKSTSWAVRTVSELSHYKQCSSIQFRFAVLHVFRISVNWKRQKWRSPKRSIY